MRKGNAWLPGIGCCKPLSIILDAITTPDQIVDLVELVCGRSRRLQKRGKLEKMASVILIVRMALVTS